MRAVIFDLDGTLADTLDDIAGALNHVLGELGFEQHAAETQRQWVGWGVTHLVKQALPDVTADMLDMVSNRFRVHYAENLVVDTQPYPGIPALLDALQGAYELAVCSNKPQAMTTRMITQVFARWRFAEVIGARDEVPRKPDPTAALGIAERLALKPDQCVFVGDTAVDMQTAVAAGMLPIGVAWGFRNGAELLAAGARQVLAAPSELLDVLH